MRTRTVMTMMWSRYAPMPGGGLADGSGHFDTSDDDHQRLRLGHRARAAIQSDQLGAYKNAKNLQSYMYSAGRGRLDAYNVKRRDPHRVSRHSPSRFQAQARWRRASRAAVRRLQGACDDGVLPLRHEPDDDGAGLDDFVSDERAIRCRRQDLHDSHESAERELDGHQPREHDLHLPDQRDEPLLAVADYAELERRQSRRQRDVRSVGQLDVVGSSKGARPYTKQGQFYFSFLILATNP